MGGVLCRSDVDAMHRWMDEYQDYPSSSALHQQQHPSEAGCPAEMIAVAVTAPYSDLNS